VRLIVRLVLAQVSKTFSPGSKPLSNFGLITGGEGTKDHLRKAFPKGESSGIDLDRFIERRLRASVSCGPFEGDSEEETDVNNSGVALRQVSQIGIYVP